MKKRIFALLVTASLRGCGFVSEGEAEDRADFAYQRGFVEGGKICGENNEATLSQELKTCKEDLYSTRLSLASCLSK